MAGLLLMGIMPLQAQVIVKGKIVDSGNGKGLGYANVSLLSLPDSSLVQGAQADSTGNFGLAVNRTGRFMAVFTSLEYGLQRREVLVGSLAQGAIDLGRIVLLREQKLLDAVVVSGEKRAIQFRDDRTVLRVAGNSFFKTSTNVMDILTRAPGMTVNGDGTLLMSGRNTPVIFINGKPTAMSAEEQQNYLNGLSPELIESIELIANPSSRYDGQYKAIIDIKLKNEGLGWKGTINSTLRQSMYGYGESSVNLTLGTSKFMYGLRAGYAKGTHAHLYQALQQLANRNWMATRTLNRTAVSDLNVQLSVDYLIRKDQTIGLSWKSYYSDRDRRSVNTLDFSDSTRQRPVGATQNITLANPSQRNNAINLSYDGVWGKNRLNVFGNITQTQNRQLEDIQNRDRYSSDLINYWKTTMKNDILLRTVQVDFSRELPRGSLEVGAKFAFITTDNDLKYDTLSKDNLFVRDAGRTNRFLYDEYISAGYAVYNYKVKKISLRASVRVEHTYTEANTFTQEPNQKRNYLTWLPGAHFSYTLGAQQQLNFSFTRRMTRPGFAQLNPFRFYLSPLNYWVGNPYLLPSVTSVLNLSYTRKNFNIGVSLGKEEDVMTRYPEYNPVTNELLYLGGNLPYNNFANIEAGYTLTLTKWWKVIQNAGVYYNMTNTPYHGKNYTIHIVDFSLSGSHVFTLPHGITTDLSYQYKSKTGNGLYFIRPIGSLDFGLQKSWLQGKLNSKFNFYDMLNTNIVRFVFREKQIINNRLSHRNWLQRATVSFSYTFGKARQKARQNRTTEEEGRL
jgi:hypothetical protein